ncbi:MAG: insulinase family protein [Deltaproteobacteria bacterium]|jgi:zinc protease|nr:insulinase family protein [Deltaproteobacteria bacterium]
MVAPELLVERLNRGVSKRNARWTFLREHAFGDALAMRRFRLGNGLTLLTLVDRSAPTVSYHTWFRVGSRHERPGKTGLAHLFEHLMFNATRTRPLGQFDRLLEGAGAEANAATWTDWTYYYENAPRGALPLLVELEADRMSNLVLRAPQVVSEKEVVANERKLRVEDDIEGKALELLYATAFRRHPYGWPTIGWMKDIRGFTVRDCRQFYRTHYAPANATVVVAGDFDEGRVLALVQEHYGGLPKIGAVVPVAQPKEPSQRAERITQLRAPTPSEKILLGYQAPAFCHPDTPALVVVNELLFGGRSSRMHRALCVDEELAFAVRGSIAPFVDPGLFEMWIFVHEGKRRQAALERLEGEIEQLASAAPMQPELDKAINQLELSFLHSMETAGGKAEQIGFYETVAGDGSAMFDRLDAYREVTPDDVERVVKKYLRPSRRTRVEVVRGHG